MAMGLQTDGAILNQMRINKLGLKDHTSHKLPVVLFTPPELAQQEVMIGKANHGLSVTW